MNTQAQELTYGLIETLKKQEETANLLLLKASEKEKALLDDDLDALKEILELEEDTVSEFEQLEKSRMSQTTQLLSLLDNASKGMSLREIADIIDDPAASKQLNETRIELAEVVTALRDKNIALNRVLAVKNEYADMMLGALTGEASATTRTYTESGDLGLPPDPAPGVVEFFA